MATNGGKARKLQNQTQDAAECRVDNGQDTQAKAKAKSCPHPILRAGDSGRTVYVKSTLTVLDNLTPITTGRYLPDAQGHGPRAHLPHTDDLAREVSPKLEQWVYLSQDGLRGDQLVATMKA